MHDHACFAVQNLHYLSSGQFLDSPAMGLADGLRLGVLGSAA